MTDRNATDPAPASDPVAGAPHDPAAKAIVITGAARGIGRAAAELFAIDGWTVGAYDISDDWDWAESFPHIHPGHLDVTSPEDWESALAEFVDRTGRLDALINNAGILYAGPFAEAGDYAADSALVDVNVKGVLYGARAAHPYLKATPGARLINLASAAAIYGTPDLTVYSATKSAVKGFTEALELEWCDDDIAVRSLMPLFTDSGMLDGVETDSTRRLGVRLTPADVARALVDTTTSASGHLTRVHRPVGLQAALLSAGSHFSPSWLTRRISAALTTRRSVGW